MNLIKRMELTSLFSFKDVPIQRIPLQTVSKVDLGKYIGSWYEICFIPNWFQDASFTDTMAEYVPENGMIGVRNSSLVEGKWVESIGTATADDSTGAKLSVYFGYGSKPMMSNYLILDLDKDYHYAMVGNAELSMLWILCREKQLEYETVLKLLDKADKMGYDIKRVIFNFHRGQLSLKRTLKSLPILS